MSLTVAQRIKLLTETIPRLKDQVARIEAEVEKLIREVSLDVEEDQE